MAYSSNRNYQDEINKAVSSGDYALASRLEKERNEKIDGEGLSYEKTYNHQKPEGITDATYNAMNKQYTPSDKQQQLDANKQNAGNKVTNLANKRNIVSNSTWSDIESEFKTPTAVKQADAYLAEQLEKIQSGRTSYTNQLQEAMDKILKREKFSYDVDTDPLFQQALASAMGSGKQAMQDTIGQASALTGGYGSSYATTAGNQAYNAYIQDAYDNLPQYYQMAREAYEAEGDELYRQYSMFSTEDEKEYNRNITAFDVTSQYRNQIYNEEYGRYRDSKSDAFATANLEISEHGQLVNDAMNAYNIAADLADTEYQRKYNSWLDSVNIAMQQGQIERGAYEYDTSLEEDKRRYDQDYARKVFESDRTYNRGVYESDRAYDRGVYEYDTSLAEQKRQFDVGEANDMSIAQSQLAQDNEHFYASLNARGSSGGGGGGGGPQLKTPTTTMLKNALAAYNSGDMNAYNAELSAANASGYDVNAITQYIVDNGAEWVQTYVNYYNGIKIKDDTFNGGGGTDHNDVYSYTSPNGKTYERTTDQLINKINGMDMPEEQKQALIKKITSQSKK